MADLVVPQLGESITEAVIAKWLKNVGDQVAADEPLVDLETDKVTVQLPSPAAGALTEQRFKEGATVKVGDVVGQVEAGAAGKAAPAAAAKPADGDGKRAPAADPDKTAPIQAPAPRSETASQRAATAPGTPPGPAPAPPRAPTAAPAAPAVPVAARGALAKDELLKLTPSQRQVAREQGTMPGHIRA